MPQIPTRDVAVTPVPRIPAPGRTLATGLAVANSQSEATASIQQGGRDLASAAAQFALAEAKRENTQEMNRADAEISRGLNEIAIDMRSRNIFDPGEFDLRASEHIQGVIGTIKNPDVHDVVTANAQNRFEQSRRTIGMAAATIRANESIRDLDNALSEDAIAHGLALDEEQGQNIMADAVRRIRFAMDQGAITQEQGEARVAKFRNDVANASARAAITDDPAAALELLEGDGFEGLDPIARAQFVDGATRRVVAIDSARQTAAERAVKQGQELTLRDELVKVADPAYPYSMNDVLSASPRLSASGVNTLMGKLKEGAAPNDRMMVNHIQDLIDQGELDLAESVTAEAYRDGLIRDERRTGFVGTILSERRHLESAESAQDARALSASLRGAPPSPYQSESKRLRGLVRAFPPEYISFLTAEVAQSANLRAEQASAQFAEWARQHPDAGFKDLREKSEELILQYGDDEILSLPSSLRVPYRFVGARSEITELTLNRAEGLVLRDQDEGRLSPAEAAQEVQLLGAWRSGLQKPSGITIKPSGSKPAVSP